MNNVRVCVGEQEVNTVTSDLWKLVIYENSN